MSLIAKYRQDLIDACIVAILVILVLHVFFDLG